MRDKPSLLDGVTVLEREGVGIKSYGGSEGLYGDLPKSELRPVALRLSLTTRGTTEANPRCQSGSPFGTIKFMYSRRVGQARRAWNRYLHTI